MLKVRALTVQTSSPQALVLIHTPETWYFMYIFNKDIDYLVELERIQRTHVNMHNP